MPQAKKADEPQSTTDNDNTAEETSKGIESLGVSDILTMEEGDLAKLMDDAEKPANEAGATETPQSATTPAEKGKQASEGEKKASDDDEDDVSSEPLESEIAKLLGGEESKKEDATPTQQPAEGEQQPASTAQGGDEQDKVPVSVVVAMRQEMADLKNELSYLKGKSDASQQPSQPQGKTPQQELDEYQNYKRTAKAQLLAKEDELAQRFDDTDLSLKDFLAEQRKLKAAYERVEQQLDGKISELTQAINKETNPESEAPSYASEDPSLMILTQQLAGQNQWVDNVPEAAFQALQRDAVNQLQAKGVKIDNTPSSIWALRQAIVHIGKTYGYDKAFAGQSPAPVNQQQVQTTPTAQDRKKALETAGQVPPTLSQAGVRDTNTASGTPANLDGMSAAEVAKVMPAETLDRLLYGDNATH